MADKAARDSANFDAENLLGFANPEFFFSSSLECHFLESKELKTLPQKYQLLDLPEQFGEESFAKVAMGWQPEGLAFQVLVETENPDAVSFPDYRHGNAIELFIDTKAMLLARTTHRFCHHFYFLPESIDGHDRGEVTRFRTEDTHPLCSSDHLEVKVTKKAKGYSSLIFIPRECLVGVDLQRGASLGFCYRITRFEGSEQVLGIAKEKGRLEFVPYLWPTLKLVS